MLKSQRNFSRNIILSLTFNNDALHAMMLECIIIKPESATIAIAQHRITTLCIGGFATKSLIVLIVGLEHWVLIHDAGMLARVRIERQCLAIVLGQRLLEIVIARQGVGKSVHVALEEVGTQQPVVRRGGSPTDGMKLHKIVHRRLTPFDISAKMSIQRGFWQHQQPDRSVIRQHAGRPANKRILE